MVSRADDRCFKNVKSKGERQVHDYPRDLIGYGANPPDASWPNGARIAVQFVLNYEEGGESSVLHGDAASKFFYLKLLGLRRLMAHVICQWNQFMNMGHEWVFGVFWICFVTANYR